MSNKFYKLSRKERKLTQPPEVKFIKLSALALTTFLITFLNISVLTPIQPSQASELLVANQATGGYISLDASDTVNLSIVSDSGGVIRTASDTVKVTSDSAGYQLYLSTVGSTSLVRDGATSTGTDSTTGLPTYASSDLIPAISANSTSVPITSPVTLETNTWGFAVAKQNSVANSGSEDVVTTGFDDSYLTGESSSIDNKFATIPDQSNPVLIAKRTTTANQVPTTFYYAAKINTTKASGLYKSTIRYTAVSSATSTALASISPERTSQTAGGQTLEIATPSTATLDSLGTITVTVGDATCENPVATKPSTYVNVTCTSPALSTGWHEVIVTFENAGETYTVSPGIEYYYDPDSRPTLYELANGLYLQNLTSAICENAKTDTSATTNFATLKDLRDEQTYRIAKLADGNCWMVSDLHLGSTSQTTVLNSTTSDLASGTFTLPKVDTDTTISYIPHDYQWYDQVPIDTTAAFSYENAYSYNYYTATAGTGSYSTGSTVAPNSICPKNWKLPLNYTPLLNAYDIHNTTDASLVATYLARLQNPPLNFIPHFPKNFRSGIYEYKGLNYWTRTPSNSDRSYQLIMYATTSNPEFNTHWSQAKVALNSVRCVFTP